jgi:opine dehydrogenase
LDGTIKRIAILGAGNGGCAAAADLTVRGFEIRLFSRRAATLKPLQERGGVDYTGEIGEGFAPISIISQDIRQVMEGADLVIVMAPITAHKYLVTQASPHMAGNQVLLMAPGHTVLFVPSLLRRLGVQRPVICETTTLPYACRLIAPARVRISLRVKRLVFAVFPSSETKRIHTAVARVYPALDPVSNVLETVFLYTNAIHHPPATLFNAGRIEATGGDYFHYYEGISPCVGRVVDRLDAERQAVAAGVGVKTEPFVEYFYRMGYTTEEARDIGTSYAAFHQSEADRWIKAPSSLNHRFLDEDVPYGLVPLSELGRWVDVPTPTMDALIHVASMAMKRDYRSEGLTLERMGLANLSRERLNRVLSEGF